MANFYEKEIGSVNYDNLFAGINVPVLTKSVTLKSGQGVLKRGTVLGIVTDTGLAVPVDSSNTDGSEKADCILTDNIDTGDEDIVITAYSSGLFNRNALIFGGTDKAEKHETRLRELGIFLKDNIPY
ncbi:head decoration protein [Tissierella praeacuta]|uniref:head decoration protein n=1 Tax=Tissierella praeacuta TaxID=43131 RepID=UPI0028A6EEC6|nr:head decoration protein [Tissierella praeacuta]